MGNSTDELAIAIRDSDIKRNDSNQFKFKSIIKFRVLNIISRSVEIYCRDARPVKKQWLYLDERGDQRDPRFGDGICSQFFGEQPISYQGYQGSFKKVNY